MAPQAALFAAAQVPGTAVRAGTASLLSMTSANLAAAAMNTAHAARPVGTAAPLGAAQQANAAALTAPAQQGRQPTLSPGSTQARADGAAHVGANTLANRSVNVPAGSQAGSAISASSAAQPAAATLAGLAAAAAMGVEAGGQSREAHVALDREREQAQHADRNQAPMHVLAADIGRQARPAKLEKTSMLGRLLSALSGARGEGAMESPDRMLSNRKLKSSQTMMWALATVAFGSVAAGMTVFWNSSALGVLVTPSAQALTVFALVGVAAGGAVALWRAMSGADALPPPPPTDGLNAGRSDVDAAATPQVGHERKP